MRKAIVTATVLAVLLTASLSAAAASFPLSVVGGVRTHDSDLDPYVYVEGDVVDNLSIGVEYYHSQLALSLWLGLTRGFYGEVKWADGISSNPQSAEVGLWSQLELFDQGAVYGWVGAKRLLNGPATTALSLNAEAEFPVSDSLFAVIGGKAELAKNDNDFNGWLGLGYRF